MEGVLRTSTVFVEADYPKQKTHEISSRVLKIVFCAIFLCLVACFVVMGILIVEVRTLKEDMDEIAPVIVQKRDADLLDDNTLNSTPESEHEIWRRDTQGQDETISPFYHQTTAGTGTHTSLSNNFVHVAGSKYMHYEQGQYISWYNEEDASNSLSRQNMPFKQDKFIIIPKPGYYKVYAQLTYADILNPASGVSRVGHEVVREANCGQGQSEPLLSTWLTQTQNRSATDSTHMEGLFYLYTNDKIGVKIKENGPNQIKIASNPRPLNFFGAYMVFADHSFDNRLEDSCCCLHA